MKKLFLLSLCVVFILGCSSTKHIDKLMTYRQHDYQLSCNPQAEGPINDLLRLADEYLDHKLAHLNIVTPCTKVQKLVTHEVRDKALCGAKGAYSNQTNTLYIPLGAYRLHSVDSLIELINFHHTKVANPEQLDGEIQAFPHLMEMWNTVVHLLAYARIHYHLEELFPGEASHNRGAMLLYIGFAEYYAPKSRTITELPQTLVLDVSSNEKKLSHKPALMTHYLATYHAQGYTLYETLVEATGNERAAFEFLFSGEIQHLNHYFTRGTNEFDIAKLLAAARAYRNEVATQTNGL